MALTDQQIAFLKTDVFASLDPEVIAAREEGGSFTLASIYNQITAQDFWVWRTAVPKNEFTQAVSLEGTTFDWAGNGGYIARSQGERDAWRELFNGGGRGDGSVNPSLVNVRAAFVDIFSGAGAGAVTNRNHILAISKRKPTRAERLFVNTAGGNGARATPALLTFEGQVSDSDMQRVLTE